MTGLAWFIITALLGLLLKNQIWISSVACTSDDADVMQIDGTFSVTQLCTGVINLNEIITAIVIILIIIRH